MERAAGSPAKNDQIVKGAEARLDENSQFRITRRWRSDPGQWSGLSAGGDGAVSQAGSPLSGSGVLRPEVVEIRSRDLPWRQVRRRRPARLA